jgi:hypothetical protein
LSNTSGVAHAPAIAVATAVLAVLAAIGSLVSNKSASQALAAKNQEILVRTEAADAYNSYEAHVIRERIYEAAQASNPSLAGAALERLATIAREEQSAAKPYLERAEAQEQLAGAANERSEQYARAHDTYDVAVTLVEIAIAIVSVSALTSSLYLIGLGGFCAAAGVAVFVYEFARGSMP